MPFHLLRVILFVIVPVIAVLAVPRIIAPRWFLLVPSALRQAGYGFWNWVARQGERPVANNRLRCNTDLWRDEWNQKKNMTTPFFSSRRPKGATSWPALPYPAASRPRRPQELFRADTSGIHAAHDVVTVERLHVRAEISRTDSILPRERKARHLPPQQQLATILTTNILGVPHRPDNHPMRRTCGSASIGIYPWLRPPGAARWAGGESCGIASISPSSILRP